ncbi:MAG: 4Fe-4S dicluster domain-containing protein [Planctomycetota bacterium]|nr:4Fe-4S dicluster domain-containing protein [Planctomycetota bacterium]
MQPASNAPIARTATSLARRDFLKATAVLTALTVGGKALANADAPASRGLRPDRKGVLVDLGRCIGCRRCEWACADANDNPHGSLESYDDQSAFATRRSPAADSLCVVNSGPATDTPRSFVKIQCMHCEKPPCVSACLVGAMQKDPRGPVTYDASKCIGCRYCMVACPFDRLAYEYQRGFTPRVRKCELCQTRTVDGKLPACVEICPVEALQYGTRDDLLRIAHDRIRAHPEKYVNHVYGKHEGGGTSWLYLSPRPFEQIAGLGLPSLPDASPAERTELIQHTFFKWASGPILLASLLAGLNHLTRHHTTGAHA